MIDINEQNAKRDIYNINNLVLENSPEVMSIIAKQNQELLKNQFSISYNQSLQKVMFGKKLVNRDYIIDDINNNLDAKQQLLLYGDPGIGKTTIVHQLLCKSDNFYYISIKRKSALNVISYLINKIKAQNKEDLLEIEDLTKAIDIFQVELQKSKLSFVIDDCESDSSFVKDLIQLDKFDTNFLFISRNRAIFETVDIDFYSIKNFSEEEVSEFLAINEINTGQIKFNELYIASKGNPLYLFYFSQMQISPLPKDIQNYQNTIWKNLNITEQELLIFIAIPFSSLSFNELKELKQYESALKLSNDIDKLSNLVNNDNGTLNLFHPSFCEHIISFLESKGFKDDYYNQLGDYYLQKENYVQATYLLIDIAPLKIKEYLQDVFPLLVNIGEITFAIKVLYAIISFYKNKLHQAYAHYHLCGLYRLIGNSTESNKHINLALEQLKTAEGEIEKQFYTSALMFKAINLIEDGNINEGLEIANKIQSSIMPLEEEFKASILVNLSKIYVNIFEFEKGAIVSREAFKIFEEKGYKDGMLASLSNLVSCLAQINDHLDDAEEYGLKLLKLLNENYDSIKEVIVLNALTSIYRQKGDYPQALKYADRVIKLCQKYGLKDKVVLNLINYGNVLRDDNQLEQALNIYNEALVVAKEYKLKKEEGRIYWILAGIERGNHQYNKSIEYADKSITINKSINFYYGVANAYREKSETLILKGSKIEAAEMLEESAEFYLKIEHFASSYQSKQSEAIKLYKEEEKSDDVNRVLNKLICNTSKKLKYDKLSKLILDTTNSNTETILENFYKVFEHHFKENNSSNLTLIFLDYLVFCQGVESNKGKSAFIKSLNLILDHLSVAKFSFSLLAIAIEQSRDLLDFNDINYINQRLQDVLPFYNFRILGEECILMTSINQSINLEIHLCNDELICLKLTMMIVLFLNENPDLMANNKDKLEKYCKICLFCDSVELRDVIVNNSGEVVNHFSEKTQSLHLEKKDYKTEEFIIIGEDFSKFSNFNTFSDNKVSLYFLVMTLAGIKGHLYHEDIKNNAKNRIEILHSVAKLFDYNQNKAVGENNQSAYNIDFGSFHK